MRNPLLLLVFGSICSTVIAQERKIFKINPGEKVVYAIPFDQRYTFSEFRKGTVNFRNGKYAAALINYNALFGEMQFIDPKGDTLSIADPGEIKSIIFSKDTFYFNKGYLKSLGNYDGKVLAEKTVFDFVNKQKIGGMGEVSSASIDTYSALSSSSIFKELVAREIITLGRYSYLYIGDAYGNFELLNKKTLLSAFYKREKEVNSYLKAQNINLNNRAEVQGLLTHFSN